MTVYDMLLHTAQRMPTRIAILDGSASLDYRTLLDRVDMAAVQLSRVGIGHGCCVGVMLADGWPFIVSCIAASACGAVVMPIAKQVTDHELDEMMSVAGCSALLCDENRILLRPQRVQALPISEEHDALLIRTVEPRRAAADELMPNAAFIRFNSGTTGREKGVVLSHQAVVERTAAANRSLDLGDDDTVLWVMPMAHHFFTAIVMYLRYGVTIALSDDRLPRSLIESANATSATFFFASPVHYRWLVADESGRKFSSLRRAISTSTRLECKTARAFADKYDFPVAQAYGIIEAGLPIANLDAAAERPESIGKALPDFEIRILDDHGESQPAGIVGELAVRGPGLFSAYLEPPRLSDRVLRDGWFLTGDLARQDDDGFVEIVGRCRAVINVAGEKVFPHEVEDILSMHPLVDRCRVVGRDHAVLGEVVAAEIVARKSLGFPDRKDLISHCSRYLSDFKIPHSIECVEKLDETTSGKIRYRE